MSRPLQAVLLIVGTAVAWGIYFLTRMSPDSPLADETIQEKQASLEAAFSGEAVDVADEDVERFVRALYEKSVVEDTDAIKTMIDVERTYAAMTATLPEDVPFMVRTQLVSMLKDELAMVFDPTMTKLDIRRIERDSEGNVVVYLVMFDADQIQYKERWWLFDGGDGLHWWDKEQLEMGLRVSSIMSVSLAAAMGGKATVAMGKLQELIPLIEAFDPTDMEQSRQVVAIAEATPMADLPKSLRSFMLLMQAAAHSRLEQPDQVLATLERIEQDRLAPFDVPIRHHLRAIALLDLERWDESVTAEKQFLELLGDDAESYSILGSAELGRDDAQAALAAFERGIACNPSYPDNYTGAALATDDHAKLVALLQLAPDTDVVDMAALAFDEDEDAKRFDKAAAEAHPGWQAPTAAELPEPEGQ